MRHYLLYEDELPPKLLVIFSKEIADKIESIDSYNHLNETSLEQWRDYLEGLINWLSNPVIAWDYLNRYQHDSDGTTHIVDIGYDVTFIIKENKEGKNYIDILAMKFNLEEYGLELPPNLQENTLKNNQNKTYKTMNRIRLTESQLHNVIKKCINEAIDNEDKVQKAVKALISILPVVDTAGTSCIFDGYEEDPQICELIIEANGVITALYRHVSEKNKTYLDRDAERYD